MVQVKLNIIQPPSEVSEMTHERYSYLTNKNGKNEGEKINNGSQHFAMTQ